MDSVIAFIGSALVMEAVQPGIFVVKRVLLGIRSAIGSTLVAVPVYINKLSAQQKTTIGSRGDRSAKAASTTFESTRYNMRAIAATLNHVRQDFVSKNNQPR